MSSGITKIDLKLRKEIKYFLLNRKERRRKNWEARLKRSGHARLGTTALWACALSIRLCIEGRLQGVWLLLQAHARPRTGSLLSKVSSKGRVVRYISFD